MTKTAIISILGIVLLSFTIQTDFLNEQKKYERVKTALKEKQGLIEKTLIENQVFIDNLNLLIVCLVLK